MAVDKYGRTVEVGDLVRYDGLHDGIVTGIGEYLIGVEVLDDESDDRHGMTIWDSKRVEVIHKKVLVWPFE